MLLERMKSFTRSSLALWCRATESMDDMAEEHEEIIVVLNADASRVVREQGTTHSEYMVNACKQRPYDGVLL